MALNVAIQTYRGTKANLSALASTGKAGVLAWATDSQELYVDSGSGTGIGPGNAWLRVASDTTVTTVANQAARLALVNQLIGDIAIQSDTGVTYVLTTLPASTNGNWTAIGTSSSVTSVNGHTGVVVLQFTDFSGQITEAQLPTSIGAGSALTNIDAGTF